MFAPSGIKTPARAQPAGAGRPAVAGEPFADEAVAFTRETALQRDCEVVVETMDKVGGVACFALAALRYQRQQPGRVPSK